MNPIFSESRFKGKRLTFLPWLHSATGYARHAVEYFRNFEKLGVFVSVRPVYINETEDNRLPMDIKRAFISRDQPEEAELILSPASVYPMRRKREILFTMYESSRWPAKLVKLVNRADHVIVPSEFCRQGLRESGCIQNISVVNLGFNPDTFKVSPMKMDGATIFGSAGRAAHGIARKGLNVVLSAFSREFPNEPDVELHIKGLSDSPTPFVLDKRVKIRDAFIKEKQLAEFYSSLTCFVSAARGEGFGLMQLEAMTSGRPVIASIYGGLQEFMTPENSYACDFQEGLSTEAWSTGGSWAIPDENHIRSLMRQVYRNRQEAQQKGIKSAQDVAHLTWRNSAWRTLECLESLGAI